MSKLVSLANLSHFQPKLEYFRSKVDPYNGFWTKRVFPHGFGTIRAYMRTVLVIYIIFIIRSPSPKMAILRDFNTMLMESSLNGKNDLIKSFFVSKNN